MIFIDFSDITNIAPVDYADLSIIDLSKMDSADGRAVLASQVRDAMLTHGFFYVVNHGYSQSQGSFLPIPYQGLRLPPDRKIVCLILQMYLFRG